MAAEDPFAAAASSDLLGTDPGPYVAPEAPGAAFDMSMPSTGMGAAAGEAYADPFAGVPVPSKDMGGSRPTIPEMNPLRDWEDKHERELEEMSQKEQGEKNERKANAAAELKAWYQEREDEAQKRMAANRAEQTATESSRAESVKGLNPWERVADLIDTRGVNADTARDTTRMRALLIQLKTSPVGSAA